MRSAFAMINLKNERAVLNTFVRYQFSNEGRLNDT
jgi:hypothetical protein